MKILFQTRKLIATTALFWLVLLPGYAAQGLASEEITVQSILGPETFTRGSTGKDIFTRLFNIANTSAPYTIKIVNGAPDGSMTVKKGWLTLNDQDLLDPGVFNRRNLSITIAIHPSAQNELRLKLKGGEQGSFVTLIVEPTLSTVLNNPNDPGFDSRQTGIGNPNGVTVDQTTHHAFIADRYYDSVIDFDIANARIVRNFSGLDGDSMLGNGATTSVSFNTTARTIAAVNEGVLETDPTSLAVVNADSGSTRVVPLPYAGVPMHSRNIALNPNMNVAAVDGQFTDGKRAYFVDLSTGIVSARDEQLQMTAPVFNAGSNEFVFSSFGENVRPGLVVYSALPPFQRIRRVDTNAPAGTRFEKLAVYRASNVVAAVNRLDSAVYVFNISTGELLARLPIRLSQEPFVTVDIAVNQANGLAVVTGRFTGLVSVINLNTQLLVAEIPLPDRCSPLGVAIDESLNRAVIAENGLSSTTRNGSIFILQLPAQ
ncbi:MAG: hypothetical protein DMF61_09030 [Blastocatellia bacterium AA13]|nr:MAG: hypothetical protein DMF61_09030 [Blastocatellia bacterium AA13]